MGTLVQATDDPTSLARGPNGVLRRDIPDKWRASAHHSRFPGRTPYATTGGVERLGLGP